MNDAASSWEALFDAAMPALDHVFRKEPQDNKPDWTFGGGTALMLQINHRVSHDIDIFLQHSSLKAFTPNQNPAAARISQRYQWPGHYVKFERPDGEVDFLSAPLQTSPGYDWNIIRGRRVALETPEEIIVKKIRYRSQSFTTRDTFDLAAVSSVRPRLALTLVAEVGDALPRLAEALRVIAARGWSTHANAIAPTGMGVALLPHALLRATRLVQHAIELSSPKTSKTNPKRVGRDPTD